MAIEVFGKHPLSSGMPHSSALLKTYLQTLCMMGIGSRYIVLKYNHMYVQWASSSYTVSTNLWLFFSLSQQSLLYPSD